MEAKYSSKTSVDFHGPGLRYMPDDKILHGLSFCNVREEQRLGGISVKRIDNITCNEKYSFLGCNTVQFGRHSLTFL
jgi:hypothetical protein